MTAIAKVRVGGAWVDSVLEGYARVGGVFIPFAPGGDPDPGDQSLFTGETPSNVAEDGVALSQGIKFRSSRAGTVSMGRWWAGASPPTSAKCALYRVSDQVQLAVATFGSMSSLAWTNKAYSAPVAILADTDYMAVCWTSNRYPYTPGYSFPHVSGDLTALASYFKVSADIAYPDGASSLNFNCDLVFNRS